MSESPVVRADTSPLTMKSASFEVLRYPMMMIPSRRKTYRGMTMYPSVTIAKLIESILKVVKLM